MPEPFTMLNLSDNASLMFSLIINNFAEQNHPLIH